MTTNQDIIRATYEGSSEENGKHLLAALAADAIWTEAAGFPYAGTYTGRWTRRPSKRPSHAPGKRPGKPP